MAQTLIVIVSRDRAVLEGLGRSLLRKGLAWRGAEDLDEAWRLLSSASVLAVVGDVDCDGLSLCKELPRRFGADAPPCLLLDTMSKEWVATWQSVRQNPTYTARHGKKIPVPGSALRHDK